MAKDKNAARYDKDGVRRVMRKRDYFSDFSGQLALGLMANIVGQLNYFYTDKVGLAVGSVGIILAISKVVDAFTDVIAGNLIDHSSGGDHKYFKWILPQIIPAAAIVVLMFTVPIQAGQIPGVLPVPQQQGDGELFQFVHSVLLARLICRIQTRLWGFYYIPFSQQGQERQRVL